MHREPVTTAAQRRGADARAALFGLPRRGPPLDSNQPEGSKSALDGPRPDGFWARSGGGSESVQLPFRRAPTAGGRDPRLF